MTRRDHPLTPEGQRPPKPTLDLGAWGNRIAARPPHLKDSPPKGGPLPKENR